jgi:hypothetical protein
MKLYARGGFIVSLIMIDGKFDKLELEFELIEINTTAACEHVGKIEQSIHTIKEHAQSISSVLPSTTLPKLLEINLIYYVVIFFNVMPYKTGISDTILLREIVMRHRLDWNKHYTGEFGKYVEAHSDPDETNKNKPCTFAGIYLGVIGNIQGTKKVFNLKTGTVKKPRSVTVLPISDMVIKQVDTWGKKYQEEEKRIR